MLRNWTLQMVKMANSMLCIFYHYFKKLYCVPIMCQGLILAGEKRDNQHIRKLAVGQAVDKCYEKRNKGSKERRRMMGRGCYFIQGVRDSLCSKVMLEHTLEGSWSEPRGWLGGRCP